MEFGSTSLDEAMEFDKAYQIGRRKIFPSWWKKGDNLVLSLDQLLQAVKPQNSFYRGVQDIPVNKIIGTENRANDFSLGFYPTKREMESRWTKIRNLLLAQEILDAITVFEYGGYYFVRDGNHRVSVARTNHIEFLNADVTSLQIPINLPPEMNRKKLPLFQAKHDFYRQTKVFDYIPEENFKIAIPQNWRYLQKEIFEQHKKWFVREHHRNPEDKELIEAWNFALYEDSIEYIERSAFMSLYPGKRETDIFCDMIRFWNALPDPASKWSVEIWDIYMQRARKTHWFFALPQSIQKLIKNYQTTEQEERDLFLKYSKLFSFCPNAVLPVGNRKWYRFLAHQLLQKHFQYLKEKLGKVPYIEELTKDWYENPFLLAYQFHQNNESTIPFSQFYMDWSRVHYHKLFSGDTDVTPESLEKTFKEPLK